MLYLIINNENEIIGRFLSLNHALRYLEERNDVQELTLQAVTAEEYERMRENFFKSFLTTLKFFAIL